MVQDRYIVIPCEAPEAEGLAVIWDRQEQQVLDVIDAEQSARYAAEDSLWSAALSPKNTESEHD